MREPLRLVGVSRPGVAMNSVVLLPGSFRRLDDAAFIIELPLASPVPVPGAAIELVPIVAG